MVGLASGSQHTYPKRLPPRAVFFQAANACLTALPEPLSGSNRVVKLTQFEFCTINAAMNDDGDAAAAPCERTAPVAEVQFSDAANVPVA